MTETTPTTATDVQPALPPAAVEAAKAPDCGANGLKTREFPRYTRSLLRIRVPVVVTLAEKKQPLERILELGPGMIIHFDKSCDETLDLEVNNRRIAQGEVVKVGDKFGLRITGVVAPQESFASVGGKANCASS
jgi:flagellar motor switch protein FliN/FliY